MGRIIGPACRLCRREGVKLTLKGTRCDTAKCPMERQDHSRPPGMFSWHRGRGSEYAVRLREKQKVKRYYGLLERQFRLYFRRAERQRGNTGDVLLNLLERRLDNVVYKLRFARSRRHARQSIAQGHIRVNNRKVDVPSYLVKVGDKITLKNNTKTQKMVKAAIEIDPNAPIQSWLVMDPTLLEGTVRSLPTREDVLIPVEDQLIIELCSR